MENKLLDYAGYYIGCGCVNTWFPDDHGAYNPGWKLIGVRADYPKPYCLDSGTSITWTDSIKLILRQLECITDEEKTHIGKLAGWYEGKKIINNHHFEIAHDVLKEMAYDCLITADNNVDDRLGPKAYFSFIHYLLKQQFDIFGLIELGFAIDKNA